jgi:hypothetical protein
MEEECRRVMQKGIMAEVRGTMHQARSRKCIFMTIAGIITKVKAVVMDITDKKKSTEFFSAFL